MKLLLGLVVFLSSIALCSVLHIASSVFIPLVIAWFILQMLRPIVQIGKTLRLNAWLNVILVFSILTCIGLAGFKFLAAQVVEFGHVYALYSDKLIDWFANLMEVLSVPPETVKNFNWMGILKDNAKDISSLIIALSSKFVMTFVFLMFMLIEAPYLDDKIEKAFRHNAKRVKKILFTISEQVSRYLGTLALISFATGVCAWIVLTLLGVKLAAGWGVLTFLLNFIPTVGSIIATIPPVIMAVIQFSPGLFKPFLVLMSLTAIQVTIGNIITPKVVGDRLGVSPVMILLSLLLWGMIWGIPGALLSTPIISIIKIVCENIPSLHSIAVLIGSGEAVRKLPSATPKPATSAKIDVVATVKNKIADAAQKVHKRK
ncbi:MAG: AI-2E family transporter, partial [Synergistaceae bacterium]|nr:AI-2E family transporter [Synergistaceae bacterium]